MAATSSWSAAREAAHVSSSAVSLAVAYQRDRLLALWNEAFLAA